MPLDTTALGPNPLLGIVRFHGGGDVSGAVDALARGGIELLEVTVDTPGALTAVARAAGEGKAVGVGTVTSAAQVHDSVAAGAQFVVSPGLIPEVIESARVVEVEPIPGVYTATEILAAKAAGARLMKLFPAAGGGPSYLRALRAPFPETALVPTGGIRIDEIQAYFAAGATIVALGGELVGRRAPRSDADLDWITAQAARAVAAARNAVPVPVAS